MESVIVTTPQERKLFLSAALYCSLDLALHYFGLIESASSVIHVRSIWLFFIAEFAFAFVGVALVWKLWRVPRPTTLGRGLPASALLIVTILFTVFNVLFALVGFLLKFTGGS